MTRGRVTCLLLLPSYLTAKITIATRVETDGMEKNLKLVEIGVVSVVGSGTKTLVLKLTQQTTYSSDETC